MNYAPLWKVFALVVGLTTATLQAQTAGSSILTNQNKADGSVLVSVTAQIYPLFSTGRASQSNGNQQLYQGQILPQLYQAKPKSIALMVNAFPNPCHDVLFIEVLNSTEALHHAILFDVTGKKVQQPAQYYTDKTLTLHLNDVRPGVYSLALFQNNSEQAAAYVKLIKQ